MVHRVKPQTRSASGDFANPEANPYAFPSRPHFDPCLYVCFSQKGHVATAGINMAEFWFFFWFFVLSPALESYIHRSNQFKR